jgi:transcriptional regulator GlxA family with amidase domain
MATDIVAVKSWVEQHISEIRTYDDVARTFMVSRESLRKAFVRKEKTTLTQFIGALKLRRCQEMLRSTELLCFQIIYELKLGRDDVAARWFKRQTGVTMSEYRKTSRTPIISTRVA